MADYDRANGVLNITKTRVRGRDRDQTKNGRDRRVVLYPRAIAALERQLRWRAQRQARRLIDHDALFVTETGQPPRSSGNKGAAPGKPQKKRNIAAERSTAPGRKRVPTAGVPAAGRFGSEFGSARQGDARKAMRNIRKEWRSGRDSKA